MARKIQPGIKRTERTARKNPQAIQPTFTTAKGRTALIQQLFVTPKSRTALGEWVQHNIDARQHFEQKISEGQQALKTEKPNRKLPAQLELQKLQKECTKTLTYMEAKVLTVYIEQIEKLGKPNIQKIAEAFKISAGMVDTHVSNAKKKLKRMLIDNAIAKGAITLDDIVNAYFRPAE